MGVAPRLFPNSRSTIRTTASKPRAASGDALTACDEAPEESGLSDGDDGRGAWPVAGGVRVAADSLRLARAVDGRGVCAAHRARQHVRADLPRPFGSQFHARAPELHALRCGRALSSLL